MRQIVASLMLTVFLVGGWITPSWSLSEAEVVTTLETHRKEREKIRAEMEKRKRGQTSSIPRGPGGADLRAADQDRNGCVDAREANEWELITRHRYEGQPWPWCKGQGPDVPGW